MSVRFDNSGSFVRVTLSGDLHSQKLYEQAQKVLSDPDFVKGKNVLIDFRDSEETASREEISSRVDYLAKAGDWIGPRIAFLVGTSVQFGLGRMAELYADARGLAMRPFMNEAEAIDWLEGP